MAHPGTAAAKPANVARPGMAVGKRPTWPTWGWRRGSGQRGPPGGGSGETRNKSPGRKSGGTGPLSEPGQDYHVNRELHWYESHGIGRRELKIKRFV